MIDPLYQLDAYDYHLPSERIAQFPEPEREHSKLLILTPDRQRIHRHFADILGYLRESDLLVVNTTKVFPARLLGHKATGGKVELFLLHFPVPLASTEAGEAWREARATALLKSSKRPKAGSLLVFSDQLRGRVEVLAEDGKAVVTLQYQPRDGQNLETVLNLHGQVPLPPYINRPQGNSAEDVNRYQTRYARQTGSVAAPTAGLHFSDALLTAVRQQGVSMAEIVLHVGYGTFAPVRTEDIREHRIHREWVEVSRETADQVNRTKAAGGRIWAVGTTTVRTLEFATDNHGLVQPTSGECDHFIYPGYAFRVVDNLITNFHLPKSSLLFLVSALAGREAILTAYEEAITLDYRFFSYGDAMAILTKA